jgi:4-alpha-glucanotransferase
VEREVWTVDRGPWTVEATSTLHASGTTPHAPRSRRSAGVLLHPTSLPGPYGIGDLGQPAYDWVDFLSTAKQSWWQILPLGPTGYGDSPYQCFSAFAGNPYLISPDLLVRDGLIRPHDLDGVHFPASQVHFGPVIEFKNNMLRRACANFRDGAAGSLKLEFEAFCRDNSAWLEDFSLFMALKDAHGGKSWLEWPLDCVLRKPEAMQKVRRELSDTIFLHQFRHFLFFHQWGSLTRYAHERGVRLIGDVPIFLSSDSADVWSHPDLFWLDENGQPTVVAGVPPDYFSKTGQLWGNPLYNWQALQKTEYEWWVARIRATLEQVDLIRLDHFRGFEGYWEIPAGMPTAEIGRWVPGPGIDLFRRLGQTLGALPMIAENLGVITPDVEALREQLGLPGMRILQFAFDNDSSNPYLPHHYNSNTVVYTGTHDNDTTRGWYESIPKKEAQFLHRYLTRKYQDIVWDLIGLAWSSVADFAIVPLQDLLNLGTEARMNTPARPSGNWRWRFTQDVLTASVVNRLAEITELYSRTTSNDHE